ncbi:unnamed protein product [Caenorhabditis angaria]|uniref:DUF38 domain-containing protein n=1 Tax=Caenorhabditis angaria TaxID=860376 RepID=A0A9P1ICT5_9PELO|nr:unnamed protein product [Caenorhabditis angaria]
MSLIVFFVFGTFLSSIYAGKIANSIALDLLTSYGTAILERNQTKLFEVLSKDYKFYHCEKNAKSLNRDDIWKTVEFMPNLATVLSRRELIDTGLSNENKTLAIVVNLGNFTETMLEAHLRNGKFVIIFEQENKCKSYEKFKTTYMIDYKKSATKTSENLLGQLFESAKLCDRNITRHTLMIPFYIFYYNKNNSLNEKADELEFVKLGALNMVVPRTFFNESFEVTPVDVIYSNIYENGSVIFEAEGIDFQRIRKLC